MAELAPITSDASEESWPLENGDRLDQPTFHARYEAMPEHVRAELIGGIVYMPSPARKPHSRLHTNITWWLRQFESGSPGTQVLTTPSVILSDDSEPEPDAVLRILPSYGGKTSDIDDYVTGAPELVVEVAASTVAYDLNQKKDAYERAGIDEYIVLVVRGREVRWFVMNDDRKRYVLLEPGEDGILRSRHFPGLWLDGSAFFGDEGDRLQKVLEQGLGSPEHQSLVESLAARAREAD